MRKQLQILKQELTVSEILRTYGKQQFKQIQYQYSDGHNGRCALGVIMSYYGWNGHDESLSTRRSLSELIGMRHTDIDMNLIIDLNDAGSTFDEIANYLDMASLIQNSVNELTCNSRTLQNEKLNI
jgi:hypothetical protein